MSTIAPMEFVRPDSKRTAPVEASLTTKSRNARRKLTPLGKRLIAHHSGMLPLNVWVTYVPRHGRSKTKAFIGTGAVVIRRR